MASPFSLTPKPTFKAVVTIPRRGDDDGMVTFTFKHMPIDVYQEFTEKWAKKMGAVKTDKALYSAMADHIMEFCSAWALPDAFTKDNVLTLILNYPHAYQAIASKYHTELIEARVKN
ncbi:tail assembly protein [Serratia phage vB_SmaM-Susuwatari]|nr:tail assembly protein [Serratia phage vB_SmaM-Susuwatari]